MPVLLGTNVLGEGAPVRAAALVETPTAATVCCWDDEPATVEVEGVDIVAGVELVDLVAAEVAGVVDLDLDLGTGGVDLDLATGGVDLGLATGGVDLGLGHFLRIGCACRLCRLCRFIFFPL